MACLPDRSHVAYVVCFLRKSVVVYNEPVLHLPIREFTDVITVQRSVHRSGTIFPRLMESNPYCIQKLTRGFFLQILPVSKSDAFRIFRLCKRGKGHYKIYN